MIPTGPRLNLGGSRIGKAMATIRVTATGQRFSPEDPPSPVISATDRMTESRHDGHWFSARYSATHCSGTRDGTLTAERATNRGMAHSATKREDSRKRVISINLGSPSSPPARACS
jgi:hypothetical protein